MIHFNKADNINNFSNPNCKLYYATTGIMKTVPSLYTLLTNTIYLSLSTKVERGQFSGNAWYNDVVIDVVVDVVGFLLDHQHPDRRQEHLGALQELRVCHLMVW